MSSLILTRQYTPWGVVGHLTLPTGWSCHTLERPWLHNRRNESCIPEGVYQLRMRVSPVVQRITRGRYQEGWEITDVPERTHIMVHPGNWVRNSDGCLLVGADRIISGDELMVTHSQATFDRLMAEMGGRQEWTIEILPYRAGYP